MNHARLLHDLRILADGTVATVGGGKAYKYTGPQKTLEIYDPSSGTWSDTLPQQASRMYHATSLLLPDGRLWSAGQDSGDFMTKVEVYSPPYLFRGPRPTIQSSPQQISYNSSFSISTPDALDISKIALVRPAAVTHQIDTGHRYVTLGFTANEGQLTAQAPVNGRIAPPGWYMLFILNSQGVPAAANWIHLQ
jgi:galactose oxidase